MDQRKTDRSEKTAKKINAQFSNFKTPKQNTGKPHTDIYTPFQN